MSLNVYIKRRNTITAMFMDEISKIFRSDNGFSTKKNNTKVNSYTFYNNYSKLIWNSTPKFMIAKHVVPKHFCYNTLILCGTAIIDNLSFWFTLEWNCELVNLVKYIFFCVSFFRYDRREKNFIYAVCSGNLWWFLYVLS